MKHDDDTTKKLKSFCRKWLFLSLVAQSEWDIADSHRQHFREGREGKGREADQHTLLLQGSPGKVTTVEFLLLKIYIYCVVTYVLGQIWCNIIEYMPIFQWDHLCKKTLLLFPSPHLSFPKSFFVGVKIVYVREEKGSGGKNKRSMVQPNISN